MEIALFRLMALRDQKIKECCPIAAMLWAAGL
jgi:hypothetical protein